MKQQLLRSKQPALSIKKGFSTIRLHEYMQIKNTKLKFRVTGLARKSTNDRSADFLPMLLDFQKIDYTKIARYASKSAAFKLVNQIDSFVS